MYFEVQVDDVQRAVAFYREVFEWTITQADEELPVEYWRIHARQVAGGILQRPAAAPAPHQGTNAFVCSFEVESVDDTQETVVAHGGQVALPKFAVPGKCWQEYFLDPEGNTFGVFEIDTSAQ